MSKKAKENRRLLGSAYTSYTDWVTAKNTFAKLLKSGIVPDGYKIKADRINYLGHNYIVMGGKLFRIEDQKLGEGGFGYVKLVTDEQGKQFVVKITDLERTPNQLQGIEEHWLKKFQRLIGQGNRSTTPYLVSNQKVYDLEKRVCVGIVNSKGQAVYNDGTEIPRGKFIKTKHYAIQALAEGKEVYKLITSPEYKLTNLDKLEMAHAICKAVAEFHDQKVVHRDIKPENMFYDLKSKKATLVDFGLSGVAGSMDFAAGTPGYMSPELDRAMKPGSNVRVSTAHDVYAVGKTLQDIGLNVRINSETASIIAKMLHSEASSRPSIDQVIVALAKEIAAQSPVVRATVARPIEAPKPAVAVREPVIARPPVVAQERVPVREAIHKPQPVVVRVESPVATPAKRVEASPLRVIYAQNLPPIRFRYLVPAIRYEYYGYGVQAKANIFQQPYVCHYKHCERAAPKQEAPKIFYGYVRYAQEVKRDYEQAKVRHALRVW